MVAFQSIQNRNMNYADGWYEKKTKEKSREKICAVIDGSDMVSTTSTADFSCFSFRVHCKCEDGQHTNKKKTTTTNRL